MASVDCTSDEASYAVTIGPAEGVLWGRDPRYYDYLRRCELSPGSDRYTLYEEAHLILLDPAPLYGEAGNVINGFHRRYSTNPVNFWSSPHDQPLPQTLTLGWPSPQTFDCVQLTFDTLTRAYVEMPINREDLGVSGRCVRDYDLQIWQENAWRTVLQERGNYHRHRVHRFRERLSTDRLRLIVLATNEEGWPARVYEIRVYDDSQSPRMG